MYLLQETVPTAPPELAEAYIALLGIVVSFVMRGLRAVLTVIDKLPAFGRTLIVGALAAGVTLLVKVSGLDLPLDITTWSDVAVQTVIVWLSAMGFNAAAKALMKPAA